LNNLDFDLPIINQAIVKYFTDGIPVRQTIEDCDDLHQFQKVVKLSYKYDGAALGYDGIFGKHKIVKKIPGKVQRVFASTNQEALQLFKLKNGSLEKIGFVPKHGFIDNGNVKNKKVPPYLDREWYIKLAQSRVRDFEGE